MLLISAKDQNICAKAKGVSTLRSNLGDEDREETVV